MTGFQVDFTPVIRDIKRVLSTASEEVQRRATYNAVNHVGDKARTAIRRHLAAQTSAPYGAVVKYVKTTHKAHPGNLTYKIGNKGPAMPLKDFKIKGKAGAKSGEFSVFVWHKSFVTRKKAFLIRFRSGGLTPVTRKGRHNAGGKLRQLWGPIIPKEMLRGGEETLNYLQGQLPREFVARLEHDIAQAMIRAAGKG
jgi:hypothetical protein